MFRERARLSAAITAAVAVALAAPPSVSAATITVDTNDGTAAVDDACSLPEAIVASNTDQRQDGCRRGDGPDRIAFDIAGPPVIQPASQLPDVTRRVTIDGTTEPDYAGVPVVTLDEGAATVTGLETTGNRIVIKGLVITDFTFEGLRIGGDRNRIVGNLIGVDAAGNDHGNGTGVSLEGDRNKVGGATEGARNLISGNENSGVASSGEANRIQNNFIGTDSSGNAPRPNGSNGISLGGDGATVTDNVIGGNSGNGVSAVLADEAVIRGNLIGIEADGDGALGNAGIGVFLQSEDSTVGGAKPAARNVISGNDNEGIVIFTGAEAGRNRVLGNYIGTDDSGLVLTANGADAIRISASKRNQIGGDEPGQANVICGSAHGVFIGSGQDSNRNVVSGNVIGRGADRTTELGNVGSGIRMNDTAADNMIGGTANGTGNLIASNQGGGVSIGGDNDVGNSILRNAIFDNGQEPIDLGEDGGTGNDPAPDADGGPNHLQNFPELTGANSQQDFIDGALHSAPQTQFRIEYFTSPDPSDAERFVGARNVTTDGVGNANVDFNSPKNLPAGHYVTATATVLDGTNPGDTSELAAGAVISVGP